MSSDPTTFGDRLSIARRAAGLTQDELGEAAGVGGAAVSAWEKGRNQPSSSQIKQMCDRMGASADALLGLKATAEARHGS